MKPRKGKQQINQLNHTQGNERNGFNKKKEAIVRNYLDYQREEKNNSPLQMLKVKRIKC